MRVGTVATPTFWCCRVYCDRPAMRARMFCAPHAAEGPPDYGPYTPLHEARDAMARRMGRD